MENTKIIFVGGEVQCTVCTSGGVDSPSFADGSALTRHLVSVHGMSAAQGTDNQQLENNNTGPIDLTLKQTYSDESDVAFTVLPISPPKVTKSMVDYNAMELAVQKEIRAVNKQSILGLTPNYKAVVDAALPRDPPPLHSDNQSQQTTIIQHERYNFICHETKEGASHNSSSSVTLEDAISQDTSNRICYYECEKCKKILSHKGSLLRHYKLVHNTGRSCFVCQHCQKVFGTLSGLNDHDLLVHKGIHLYKCKECHKSFTKAGNLKSHSMIHRADNPYTCPPPCGRRFTELRYLRNHMENQHDRIHRLISMATMGTDKLLVSKRH